ncbi:acetamidase/formamidase family protein [Nocardioides sp. URHA0020]|uniref:acetamidase/formamidase family protein n=1 Tax=Nocardioides sp. URHA0020 TaxID=1380392 RepID=UPI00048EF7FC|nr:acetamidase/formamidase family protein [Nocardioides sp. URHA0020]
MGELEVLQPGSGPIRGSAYLPSTADHVLWGRLPCASDDPVLTVEPGTEITFDTVSHEGILEDQGRDPKAFFGQYDVVGVLDDAIEIAAGEVPHTFGVDGPHVVSRPVRVEGARPGDLLAITVLETLPRVPYGVISNRHGKGALPGEYPRDGAVFSAFADLDDAGTHGRLPLTVGGPAQVAFPLAPFLGIMGVAVAGDARPHSVPPGAHGGNIDINLLTVGSTLYLPVQVDGALVYVGDPHFAQGDGEVSLTAMEASLRATLRLDVVPHEDAVRRFGELAGPLAETAEHLVPTGMDEDLDRAVQDCVRAAIALLESRYGMEPRLAYAYLSAATDFNISQVVDVVKGVHARIRKDDFGTLGP